MDALEKDVERYYTSCRVNQCIPPLLPESHYVELPPTVIEACLNTLVADKTMQWLERRPNQKSSVKAVIEASHNYHFSNGMKYRAKFVELSLSSGKLSFLKEMSQCGYYFQEGCCGPLHPSAFEGIDDRLKRAWNECQNEKVRQEAMLYFTSRCFSNNEKLRAAIYRIC